VASEERGQGENGEQANAPCPICAGKSHSQHRPGLTPPMLRCHGCGTLWQPLNRDPEQRLPEQYGEAYYNSWGDPEAARLLKLHTFSRLLCLLERYVPPGRLLDVGCAMGALLDAAASRGWHPTGVEISAFAAERAREALGLPVHTGALEAVSLPPGSFDAITMTDVLEHLPDPLGTLRRCHDLLAPGGYLLLTTPQVGCLSHRVMGSAWFHYKAEHLQLLPPSALHLLLEAAGFELIHLAPAHKTVSVHYLAGVCAAYPRPIITPLLSIVDRAPRAITQAFLSLPSGEQLAVAGKRHSVGSQGQ